MILKALPQAIVLAVLCGSGCQWLSQFTNRDPFGPRAACTLPQDVSRDDLVAHLNSNVLGAEGRVGLAGWRSSDVRVTVKRMPVALPAQISVQAPLNLRLRVNNPMSNAVELDVGSNSDRFWVWAKEAPRPEIVTCQHQEFDVAMTELDMALPFHPEWMMEVFGVAPLDPSEFRMERPLPTGPIVDLVADRVGPTGEDVQRVIRVNACHGIIIEHQLRRPNGSIVARATLSGHYRDPESKAIIARKILIASPDTDMTVGLEFRNVEVNPRLEDRSPIWTMPTYHGYAVRDLGLIARGISASPVEVTGGIGSATLDQPRGSPSELTGSEERGGRGAPQWPPHDAYAEAPQDAGAQIDLSLEEDWDASDPTAYPSSGGGWEDDPGDAPAFDRPGAPEIRMQSPGPARSAAAAPTVEPARATSGGWFNRLFPASRRSAAAPREAYSPKASQWSSGRPRLGLE
ncbi:MAG: hypothetical protein KF774_03010 [Planctomyces sp.]|nr:hypothetical protein [Planctomyces sp.]